MTTSNYYVKKQLFRRSFPNFLPPLQSHDATAVLDPWTSGYSLTCDVHAGQGFLPRGQACKDRPGLPALHCTDL